MRLGSRANRAPVDEENPYWMSFSDIMSGLLIIFILASVILMLQLTEKKEQFDKTVVGLEKAEQVRRTILEEAEEELKRRGIQVVLNENKTVLHIPNHILGFDSGKYEIEQNYKNIASQIGDVLQTLISKEDRLQYLDTVFVEGHTDSRPYITNQCDKDKGNWCLSAYRAIYLWDFWEQNLPPDKRLGTMHNKDGMPLFSVSGYAATRPIVQNEKSDDDFRNNRRIDIRFTIRRPDSTDYEQALNKQQAEK